MKRKDIPNFLGKEVAFVDLKTTALNDKHGLVIGWNEERERFGIRLFFDNSIKWLKPINLIYEPMVKNEKGKQLYLLINSEKLTDVERGLKIFDELEFDDKYNHTFLKIHWLGNLSWTIFNVPKIQEELEKIIAISTFDDLIVSVKILLCKILMSQNQKLEHFPFCMALLMSCVQDHYGHLPELFAYIWKCSNLESELKNGQFEILQILKGFYNESKNMYANKTCAFGQKEDFLFGAFEFLQICENLTLCENNKKIQEIAFVREKHYIIQEITFIREIILNSGKLKSPAQYHYYIARSCYLEQNYRGALHNIGLYQEDTTASLGNVCTPVSNCYLLKSECYIGLGNKSMAKQALKKLKRFKNKCNIDEDIKRLRKKINKMPNDEKNLIFSSQHQKENQNVRTKMKCSSSNCEKVEPYVGAFKHCGQCRITYYCSQKCQKNHWKNGHKNDCQEY